MKFSKKIIVWPILIAVFYFLLSYHFIVVGSSVKLLKKSKFTLSYTFFSTKAKRVETILAIDELREDGIGELLVEMGMISEEGLKKLMAQYEEDEYEY